MTAKKRKQKKVPDVKFKTGRVLVGSCLERLRDLPDGSIDSIVTDPPYELAFMGKSWDASGIAYNVELWRECLRVLKPGGHLLAFGGTRTYHRMAVAIEDAGFEIRDSIHWVYGSGFPKSLDVSKAIDKKAGAEREVVGRADPRGKYDGSSRTERAADHRIISTGSDAVAITTPATDAAKQWQGWGTALKPAHEPIVVARKPLDGTVAANVLAHGTGALNIDGCRVGSEVRHNASCQNAGDTAAPVMTAGRETAGRETAGRWPANVIFDEEAGVELDAQSGVSKSSKGVTVSSPTALGQGNNWNAHENRPVEFQNYGDTGGASRFFYCPKPGKAERNAGLDGLPTKHTGTYAQDEWSRQNMGNTPDAIRAPVANFHPTVKPVALMRYLVRLVTPPGGVVLDPFLGSGTTAAAAILEGFTWVGCEMTEDYLPIIRGRVQHAQRQKPQTSIPL